MGNEMMSLSGVYISELELENTMEHLIADWSADEMTQLLIECKWILSNNEERIKQQDVKGLKYLWRAITGINRKNALIVQVNVQEIQKLSLKIQEILMKRIEYVVKVVDSLNRKMDEQTRLMQYAIINISQSIVTIQQDMLQLTRRQDLTQWLVNIQNHRTKDNRRYHEVSDGMKILLVVSDTFQIMNGQGELIDIAHWDTAQGNLGLPSKIPAAKFYKDIIDDNESCVSLYIKDCYNYNTKGMSSYGKLLHEIHENYSNNRERCFKILSDAIQQKGTDEIQVADLCKQLFDDLAKLHSDYQNKIEVQKELGLIKKMLPTPKAPGGGPKDGGDNKDYSVLRLTPEGRWLFRDKTVSYNETDFKYDYSFPDEKNIKTYLDGVSPYMVTAPSGYFDNCKPEIKSILLNKTKYVSLADYYMYLWFEHTNKNERKSKRVAFIEYYAHEMYVSAYVVDKSGDSYQKEYQKVTIHYNKTKPNIEKAILSLPVFSGLVWESILIFKTFTADKYIDKKLEKMGVKMVDNAWEDILKTNNKELGKIINDMIQVAKES